jgi:hypothetical protein
MIVDKEENGKATMLDLIDSNELTDALGNDNDFIPDKTESKVSESNVKEEKVKEEKKDIETTDDLNEFDDSTEETEKDSNYKSDESEKTEDVETDEKKDSDKDSEKGEPDVNDLDDALDSDDDVSDRNEKPFDFKGLAKDVIGVDIEENSIDAYKKAYNESIDKAKQEIDFSKYPEDVKTIIDHVTKNEGKLLDFYNNDQLREFDRFLSLDRKSMYKEVLIASLKKDPSLSTDEIEAEAEERLDSIDDARLREVTDNYINNISGARQKEIGDIIEKQKESFEARINEDASKVKAEKEDLKKHVDSLDEFEGIKVSDKAKEKIKAQIDSGTIDKVLSENPAKLKIETYLRIKLGARIKELNDRKISEEKNKAAEESKRTERMKNHNVKPVSKAASMTDTGADDNPLSGFGDDSLYD